MTRFSLADTVASRTAAAIEQGARVLYVGRGTCPAPLLERLHERGCQVSVVLEDDAAIGEAGGANEAFNVAIVSDVVMRAEDPIRILGLLTPLLDQGGCVVAAVPNVARGTTHLEIASGDVTGPALPPARHFYTREMLEALFEACELVIDRIDRVEAPDGADSLPRSARSLLDDVLASLSSAVDAQTSHFVVRAFPRPSAPLTVFKDKIRALTRRCDLAEQRLRHLATAADPELPVDLAQKEAAARGHNPLKLREAIDALHAQLQQLRSESIDRQVRMDRLESILGRQAADAAGRDELDQFKRLGADAAAIERTIEGLRERLLAAQSQLEVMRESFSWRLTAPIRAIARRLGRTTTDTFAGRRT